MVFVDYFPAHVALNPQTGASLPDGVVEFFDISDTGFTSPVAITDVQNVPLGTTLQAGPTGAFPAFKADGYTQLVPKSGSIITPPIMSMYGLLLSVLPDPTSEDGGQGVVTDGMGGYILGEASGSGGGGAVGQELEYTTASLASGSTESGSIGAGVSYAVQRVTVTGPCRVRVYASATHRAADLALDRGLTVAPDPTTDHGVYLDISFDDAASWIISPATLGYVADETGDAAIAVTNLDDAAASVNVVFRVLTLEIPTGA